MTRRSGTNRITQPDPGDEGPGPVRSGPPSLRHRNPFAYWVAILCVVALVLSLVATALSAIL